ncbi:MAG: hypothetical protein K0S65_2174, partial [Labilithrix sp.]|nr:hypothetical protein [Labilithrix sp.]
MSVLRRARRAFPLSFVISGLVVACGSPPPATPAAAPAPVATAPKEKPLDTSPVPEPPGLVLIGRVSRPDALVAAAGSWAHLPLPGGAELVRSIADDAVADVVDLSQPIDAAVTVALSRRGVDPLVAFAIPVKSYEGAKARLGEKHRLVAGDNGQLRIEGLGSKRHNEDQGEDDDGGEGCVLAPAAQGGRIVCGEAPALEALVPYLSRTMPREKWSSDVHVEVRPEPVRAPLQELRSSLPILARSLMGSASPTVRDLIDSSLGEVVDIVNDTQKLSVDAQIADSGIVANTRCEFQGNRSLFARMVTTDRADSPPAAFWHLPGDTDTAIFGRGSDPKLFEHPRELLANLMLDATDSMGMPEAERKALKDLVADRFLTIFTSGTGIYGKGFDAAALDKAVSHLRGLKTEDHAGRFEGERLVLEQVVGWHLYQVNEPVAKVGPVLKDWSALWNRPAFAKWAQAKSSAKTLPRMRVAPAPAGVTLPKETVHLEVTIPREMPEFADPPAPPGPPTRPGGPPTTKAPKAKAKAPPAKPIVVHVFAVPDGASTWLAIGLDAKLVAQKAAASLATAPDTNTLGKASGMEALRDGKITTGGVFTLRGLMVLTALQRHDERSAFALLGSLPSKGATPIV